MKYLKISLWPESDEDVDVILDHMRTTIDREPIVDEQGDSYVEIFSDEELLREAFCLGAAFQRCEAETGIECPFVVEVLELDEPPIDVGPVASQLN